MSLILMTTLSYKALLLQGEIWCWSLLGLKGLTLESIHVLVHKVKIPTLKGINKDEECDRTTYVCNVRIQLFFFMCITET